MTAHVDERLHEHDEEGVQAEWEREKVVLPSGGRHGSRGARSRGAHRATVCDREAALPGRRLAS